MAIRFSRHFRTQLRHLKAGLRTGPFSNRRKRRPWPEALAAFTGERDLDASAIADYFAPLDRWLIEQNKNEQCGW